MKKLVAAILGLALLSGTAYADDFAKLRINISNPSADNRYFLCVGTTGCVSIAAGNRGQVYPIDSGKVLDIYTTDVTTLRMTSQSLPASCRVTVQNDQTMTVSGRIIKTADNKVVIENLNCRIS